MMLRLYMNINVLDKGDKLYISRAVDANGTWQGSKVYLSAPGIDQPPVGAPGVNQFQITYSETDIIEGSWIRFPVDGNQRRYFVTAFDETLAPTFQKDYLDIPAGPFNGTTAQIDIIDFGAFAFPAAGGETFDFVTDSNTITYTAVAGDTETEVISGLQSSFNDQSITTVNFIPGVSDITLISNTPGTIYAVASSAGSNTLLTNANTATDGEVFAVKFNAGTATEAVVSTVANPGDTADEIMGALDVEFGHTSITNVDFTPDYINGWVDLEAVEAGQDGRFIASIDVSDNGGSTLRSVTTPMDPTLESGEDGVADVTVDMEIDWDLIPGVPDNKNIAPGLNTIEYIYSIATNALAEVKVDTGDYTKQVNELQIDLGTYSIGDTFVTTITEYDTTVNTVTYAVLDDGTGAPESRSKVIDGIYAAIVTANISTISTTKDTVIGKVILTSKYPGSHYAFGTSTASSSIIGTATFTDSVKPAEDGTLPVSSQELFATRSIYYNSDDYELEKENVKMSTIDSKLKFIARWVGDTGNNIDVTIAKSSGNPSGVSDFNYEEPEDTIVDVTSNGVRTVTTTKVSPYMVVPGITLDSLFDYEPASDEIAIVVSVRGEIKEKYIVSMDPTKKDYNGKSKYIEDVINLKSNYIYVKDNQEESGMPESSIQQVTETTVEQYQVSTGQKIGKSVTEVTVGSVLNLQHGDTGIVRRDDLQFAYDLFLDKESLKKVEANNIDYSKLALLAS